MDSTVFFSVTFCFFVMERERNNSRAHPRISGKKKQTSIKAVMVVTFLMETT